MYIHTSISRFLKSHTLFPWLHSIFIRPTITPISSCWAYFKTDKQQYHTALIGECNTSTHTHTYTDNIHKYNFIYSRTHLEYLMVRSWVFCLSRLLIWTPAEEGICGQHSILLRFNICRF